VADRSSCGESTTKADEVPRRLPAIKDYGYLIRAGLYQGSLAKNQIKEDSR